MRYYLDTNILYFLLFEPDSLDADVREILVDYSNRLYTSSVCVMELVQLIVRYNESRKKPVDPASVFEGLDSVHVEIVYQSSHHLRVYASMPVLHSDPNDRIIIAQAVADKMPLISSDRQFPKYQTKIPGFNFILNKR